jgi:hypothetical protein
MSSVGFDFDGVIHSYEKGWHDGTIYGEPIDGIFGLMKYVQTQHAVFIYSVRDSVQIADWICRKWTDIACVTEDLQYGQTTQWKLDVDRCALVNKTPTVLGYIQPERKIKSWNDHERIFVTNRKLPAVAYVDDRAVRFMNPHQALNQLRQYGVLKYD